MANAIFCTIIWFMLVLIASEGGAGRIERLLASEGYKTERYDPDSGMPVGSAGLLVLNSGLNPHQGLKQLKQFKSSYPGVPVIFLTELNTADVVLSAFRRGARDYFSIPLDEAGFIKSVSALLNFSRPGSQRRAPDLRASENSAIYASGDAPGLAPASIQRALNILRHNFAGELSLGALSAEAGVSKHHFCRTFKKYIGLSPMSYLVRVRIERAKELLQNTTVSVSSAASEVGFNDLSSFIKQFKRATGCTPKSFKKTAGTQIPDGLKGPAEPFQNLRLF